MHAHILDLLPLAQTTTEIITTLLKTPIFNFEIGQLLTSFLILLSAFVLRRIIVRVIFRNLRKLASKTRMEFDDKILHSLESPTSIFLLILAFYLATIKLPIDPKFLTIVHNLFRGGSMVIVIWAMTRTVDIVGELLKAQINNPKSALIGFIPLLRKTLKIFVIFIGALIVIDNLGYSVSGVLATFGLGGAALALASKDTVANLFGSLMIVLDRPFKVGDWIQVGAKVDGDVEEIGLRSTKVRTWPKTVISIPNSVLANEYINNWTRMPKRRVKQYIGLTYSSTADQMEQMVNDIRTLLKEDEGVQQDFILVNFTDFGDSSLQILVYYFTMTTAWMDHMNVRQRINTKIMRAVEARGLSFAFPSRSLYIEQTQRAGSNDLPFMEDHEDILPGDSGPDAPR